MLKLTNMLVPRFSGAQFVWHVVEDMRSVISAASDIQWRSTPDGAEFGDEQTQDPDIELLTRATAYLHIDLAYGCPRL